MERAVMLAAIAAILTIMLLSGCAPENRWVVCYDEDGEVSCESYRDKASLRNL